MRLVEFTSDFANKKVGDHFKCDGILANTLVTFDKVAKYIDVKEAQVVEKSPVKRKTKSKK